MKSFMKNYIEDLKIAIDSLDHKKLKDISDKLIGVRHNHKTVFLIGNGGSSSTPSHSAGDLG